MKIRLIALFIIFLYATAYSQERLNPPGIMITDEKGKQVELKIKEVKVDVKVIGSIAVTTMDMTFINEYPRILEGELYFPLAEGNNVTRFAMEMNGKLREGVVVEKEKGRVVFEEVVRQNIDPALLELTKGNTFKARVYPIPAKGTKRIVLAYEQILEDSEEGMTYRLPLNFKQELEYFKLTAEIYNEHQKPDTKNSEMQGLSFKNVKEGFALVSEFKKYKADKQFEFFLPSTDKSQEILIEDISGTSYFQIITKPEYTLTEKKLPKSICILWDVSNSSATRDFEKEYSLLEEYFDRIENCRIELVTFGIQAEKSEIFNIINGNWSDLKKKLEGLVYDGGTQLGSLDLTKYKCDEFLIFSDGISNFGEKEVKFGDIPVYTINSNQNADHFYLKYISIASGGVYINLLNQTEEQAFQSLTKQAFSFISSEFDVGDISETYPSIKTNLNGSFSISGKLLKDNAKIKLNFGFGNNITYSETIYLRKSQDLINSGLLGKIWASHKLNELNLRYEKNKDIITALGKEYSIVTKNTSLLVLDRVEDYVKYSITPPDELKTEYFALLKKQDSLKVKDDQDHIEYVVKLLNTRQEWWNKDFEQERYRLEKLKQALDSNLITARGTGAITGRLIDSLNNPIQGGMIVLEGTNLCAIAGSGGIFTIRNVMPGRYTLKINKHGYQSINIPVTIQPDSIISGLFKMMRSGSRIEQVVVIGNRTLHSSDTTQFRILSTTSGFSSSESLSVNGERPVMEFRETDASTAEFGEGEGGATYNFRRSIQSSPRARNGADGNSDISIGSANLINVNTNGSGAETSTSVASGSIILKQYDPKTPYSEKLKSASIENLLDVYLEQKKEFGTNPGFYIDAAEIIKEKGNKTLALRVLSNLAELELENHQLLRILGYRLRQLGYYKYAVYIFKEVLEIRGEEPQSYRDLALAYEDNGQHQEAADMFYKVISKRWDGRFPEVELIALNELNSMLAKHPGKVNTSKFDSRLLKNLPVDVRVVLNWDSDNCDIDLWVTEPTGEKCFYSYPNTRTGGKISKDFTGGYGPEEYLMKKGIVGKYKIQANYYGSRQQRLAGPTTILLELYTFYGTDKETKKEITLRLKDIKEVVDIGEFEFEK